MKTLLFLLLLACLVSCARSPYQIRSREKPHQQKVDKSARLLFKFYLGFGYGEMIKPIHP